ncbi:MAG: ornithine carbamoyltransferase [Methanothrix sp.]|jgi:ornithine carbamoyltransferase|nr:ornithine carbamoyltransferase [Methanothrix sp.]OPX80125.1 MAG: Ornithine carbamoyltransferase [Methanosaeta sp. PtaB.Bin087]OPY52860.1 MAG: Ornithine carbamoyltransferase [Methanosaeta sp. PtaU1.Bin055]NLX39537.1 ornithine carbamoyltransferase [Methanothrix sp.]HNT72847.1 ornithine carbamoyltransferase [Methanothrix sp.]
MNLISIRDLSPGEVEAVLDRADELKAGRSDPSSRSILAGKSLAAIFEKPSTRTRVSLEVAMTDLGGHALYLSSKDLQLGRGETIADTARVLSRFVSGIAARVYDHNTIEELGRYAAVPVINALSNVEHPCQILADLMTMRERFGRLAGLKVAWVGDGNNVCNSTILAAAMMGMEMAVAAPPGYEPDRKILDQAESLGGRTVVVADPVEAVRGADVVSTDTWISMGDEAEAAKRVEAFRRYQVNSDLLRHASSEAIVLHCLPAHRGQEITDAVMDGPRSAILDQSENRLHSVKAVLERLMV